MYVETNPYNYNLPVEPDMFFGRDVDVATIVRSLTAGQGNSIALIGGRRMGKTSLLEALLRMLRHSEHAPTGTLLIPMFLDLSGEGIESVQDFFRTIGALVQNTLSNTLASLPEIPIMLDPTPPAPAFRASLETWNRAVLAQSGRRLRLILLLDECEEIVDQSWAADLHAGLRSLLVGQTTRSFIKVVMAGSHRFLSQVHQRGSPLWNVLVYHMLEVFDRSATHDLILSPSGHMLPESVVEAVTEQSGGHPRLIQYLMYHLWEEGLDKATIKDVQHFATLFPSQGNDFQDWVSGLGDTGVDTYAVLAQNTTPLTEDEIRILLQPAPPHLSNILSALCYHGVVVRDKDRNYLVAGEMFRTWFSANIRDKLNASISQEDDQANLLGKQIIYEKRRRLNALELQVAKLGITADPAITNEIDDLRSEIIKLERQANKLK